MSQDNDSKVHAKPTAEVVRDEVENALLAEMTRIQKIINAGGRDAPAARLARDMFLNFESYLRIELIVEETEASEIAKAVSMVLADMMFSAGSMLGDDALKACQIMVGEMNARLTQKFNHPQSPAKKSKIILPGGSMNKDDAKLYSKVIRGNGRI